MPAKINPMICGILNLLRIGAHKIITMTNKNMAIGSVKGKVGIKSSIYFISAKLVIFFKLSNSVKVMLNVLFFCGFVKKYYYILMELLIKNFILLKLAYGFFMCKRCCVKLTLNIRFLFVVVLKCCIFALSKRINFVFEVFIDYRL